MTQQQPAGSDFASFWQFSLAFYQQPEVKTLCLKLQDDHAMNVNILLFLLWYSLTEKKLLLPSMLVELLEAVKGYGQQVDKFRKFRRAFIEQLLVTDAAKESNHSHPIRDALLNSELLLEKEMQQAIFQFIDRQLLDKQVEPQSSKPVSNISDIELEFIATENLEQYVSQLIVNDKATEGDSDNKTAKVNLISLETRRLLQQMSQSLLQFFHQSN